MHVPHENLLLCSLLSSLPTVRTSIGWHLPVVAAPKLSVLCGDSLYSLQLDRGLLYSVLMKQRFHGYLFHVSLGIIGQLGKGSPCLWVQQNHSYPPIWASDRWLPLQLARGLLYSVLMKQLFNGYLFHVSFGIIGQLGKDLPCLWGHQKGLLYSVLMKQRFHL